MSAAQELRRRTADCHEAVDAAFGGYDLSDRDRYAALLTAHARALLPAEEALLRWPGLPRWRSRAQALRSDLASLEQAQPAELGFALASEEAAWGTLYVLEGSRLGNAMLSRQIGAGLPAAYMGARHESGEWRALLKAFDTAGEQGGTEWLSRAVDGAEQTFALYLRAQREG